MRRRSFACVAFVLLIGVLPAGAVTAQARGGSPWSPISDLIPSPGPSSGPIDLAVADRAASALRAAAARGSLEDVLRTTAELGGWQLEEAPLVPAADLLLPSLSAPLEEAIETLLARVQAAAPVVRRAAGDADAALLADVLSMDPRDPKALSRLASRARNVDVRTMTSVAASISAAIDDVLVAAPAPSSRPRAADAECDVLEVVPTLCVGGAGRNTYTTDFPLAIDLGGDDTYLNGGGMGACLAGSVFAPRCVGVVVDLAGNDVHAPPPAWNCGSGTCGQGTGVLGVGILVDAEGDDSYSSIGILGARTPACDLTAWCGSVAAQGAGGLGVGVLADLAGDDTYLAAFDAGAVGPDGLEAPEAVTAHGAGLIGSGILWDAHGDDTYEMRIHSTGHLGEVVPEQPGRLWSIIGGSGSVGQGAGLAGPGVLLDGGGDDRIVTKGSPAPDAAIPSAAAPGGQGASAQAVVQGFGEAFANEAWTGAVVTGDGDTEYTAEIEARLGAYLMAQGSGLFGAAFGMVDDAGGDDRYTLSAATDVEFQTRCDCEEAVATLDVIEDSWTTHFGLARPMAIGQGGPLGSIHDRAGNDVYRATARSDLKVSAVNTRPGGAARAGIVLAGEIAMAPLAYPGLLAQGAPGPLRDDSGNDRYVIDAARSVFATASAVPSGPGEVADEVAWAFPGLLDAEGQGLGNGNESELDDRGGLDTYVARYTASGDASPEKPGHEGDGINFMSVQGTNGLLTDFDAGQGDLFQADSALVFDTCVGRYGEGPGWVSGPTLRNGSCSPTWGQTVSSSTAPPGADTRVTFLSSTPTGDEEYPAFDVEVRLTDAAGVPLPGRRIVVVSEHGYVDPDPLVNELFPWVDITLSSADLVTDESGVARGTMPMRLLACLGGCGGLTGEVRLRAMFFGEPGAYRPGQGYVQLAEPLGAERRV